MRKTGGPTRLHGHRRVRQKQDGRPTARQGLGAHPAVTRWNPAEFWRAGRADEKVYCFVWGTFAGVCSPPSPPPPFFLLVYLERKPRVRISSVVSPCHSNGPLVIIDLAVANTT